MVVQWVRFCTLEHCLMSNSGSAKALPHGIFLICGDRAWAGIPKNVVGGPCYLGKLTLFALKQQQWLTIDSKLRNASHEELRSLQILDSTCFDEVQLWSVTARIFASFLAPGVAAAQALKQIERLACWTVKQSNHTSEILEEMLEDMNSLRHAVLQNQATIDFLLLAQGHGCKEFDGMCCFNLSDHSKLIQKQIHWLLNHTRSITKDHNPIDDWLRSVFPGLIPWVYDIIKEGVKWILIIILLVIVARILYSCLLRATAPKAALVVTDNKDQDIIHDWLQDQGGHNPKDCFALQP
ncbi:uncharacterized protein LOC110398147 [Numida meleagris]|uniref:uncharacterized protein LOC110398147 n=1 Tax=Numida meleagris TaxID=8996 RepID=UPI000B3DB587|nr:uncharacterized protein LOC110398147 [Numida meleagris]